mgnify:CR=1 FL=1
MKALVYLAHPRPDRSEINAPMFEAARGIEGITCVDLYGEYPSFEIDVDREQQRITEHDAIVFLHPLYWYSAPALNFLILGAFCPTEKSGNNKNGMMKRSCDMSCCSCH